MLAAKINVVVIKTGEFVHRKHGIRIQASEENPIYAYARPDGAWEQDGTVYSIRRRSVNT